MVDNRYYYKTNFYNLSYLPNQLWTSSIGTVSVSAWSKYRPDGYSGFTLDFSINN